MDSQMSLFDVVPSLDNRASGKKLNVVKAEFVKEEQVDWEELFLEYDELYGITFSSGIGFMEKVFEHFKHVEMIFGCDGVISDDVAAVFAMQMKVVELVSKNKSAHKIINRIEKGEIELYVSRDAKSHEKIFILKADDGRVRVITGSANMSASAFQGLQRENIVCFEEQSAYDYYYNVFEKFKEVCSDSIAEKVVSSVHEDEDYLREHIEEVPILKTIEKRSFVFLEPSIPSEEAEIVADIKGLEAEIKPLLPKIKPENGKILLSGEQTKLFKKKYKEHADVQKVKRKLLPQLHLDYDNSKIYFNRKEQVGTLEKTEKDIQCLLDFIDSLSLFHGDNEQSQRDYFKFLNWYFCSPFMPYLRFMGYKNDYNVNNFPVFGILFGDSNGGKSTFVGLLSKLMTGVKIPANSSSDFTSRDISNLKASCEGVPINIDDLAKAQYDANYEKVIKDDGWGLVERLINYPSVVITTNKLPSLKQDISKRVVTCRIDIRIDKDAGARNSKKINEMLRQSSNSFYCEYVSRMFPIIQKMVTNMGGGEKEYFPDVFLESSRIICQIISEFNENMPQYVRELSYSDYFGEMAIGKHAIEMVKTAYQTDPKMFTVSEKKNQLVYTYPENGRLYELQHLKEELPPALEAQITARGIVMKLDVARTVFGERFKKKLFTN